MTAGLILAAGESRRMGFPKALLQYAGESFLDRLIRLFAVHCAPVIVVLGARAEEIRSGTRQAATFVVNRDWQHGQTSSLQCGLAAVPAEAEGVLLTLVDHPAVEHGTLDELSGRWTESVRKKDANIGLISAGRTESVREAGSGLLCIPRYNGRRGHPIWFSRELIPEFLAVREPRTAKDVVHNHRAATEFLDLEDPGIVADIDDPAAYRSLTGAVL